MCKSIVISYFYGRSVISQWHIGIGIFFLSSTILFWIFLHSFFFVRIFSRILLALWSFFSLLDGLLSFFLYVYITHFCSHLYFFLCSYHFCSLNWWCFIRLLFRTMEILLHSRIHCSHIKKETFNARSHIYEKCQSNG